MNARLAVLLVAVPLALSCAPGAGRPGRPATPRHDPNVITAEELAGVNASNLYDAIRILRPEWMGRSSSYSVSGTYTTIAFMDRTRLGELDMLRQFSLGAALQVRWYGPAEAQGEFGLSGGMQGVIQVITRRGR